MKVLLLHEFSGVHNELQAGLRAIGIDATTANFGDSFRGFPSDILLGNSSPSRWGSIRRAARQMSLTRQFRAFDVVQSISARVFNPLVSPLLELAVMRNPRQSFIYLAASGDTVYRRHLRSLPYHPRLDWYLRPVQGWEERRVFSAAKEIVAAAWDYVYTFRREGFMPTYIPFPVMTSKVQFREIGKNRRLRVLHPVNRAAGDDYKGTSYIREAFKRLETKFKSDVEFLAVGGLPFAEYMELANSCDVVVDQAYSMAYGMSAIYAMAQGKVVLSGREPVTYEFKSYQECPIVNIQPEARQIAQALEEVLADRAGLKERGVAARQFVERYHDAVVVAEQYSQIYRRWSPPSCSTSQ